MKHKHFKEMMEYAEDALKTDKPWELWESRNPRGTRKWSGLSNISIMWDVEFDYRRIDPYRELREAEARGEVVQYQGDEGDWWDRVPKEVFPREVECYRIKKTDPYKHLREAQERGETIQQFNLAEQKWTSIVGRSPCFNLSIDRYRIKPKTKKLYLWAFKAQGEWKQIPLYAETFDVAVTGMPPTLVDTWKRLDNTMIEVEDD